MIDVMAAIFTALSITINFLWDTMILLLDLLVMDITSQSKFRLSPTALKNLNLWNPKEPD